MTIKYVQTQTNGCLLNAPTMADVHYNRQNIMRFLKSISCLQQSYHTAARRACLTQTFITFCEGLLTFVCSTKDSVLTV
jgi:hypothetical protein